MSVSRRGFLSLLGLGGAGLLVGHGLPLTAAKPLVVPATSTLMTPAWVMKEMAVMFKDALGDYRIKYVPWNDGAKLGQRIDGHTLDTQRQVTSEWDYVSAVLDQPADDDLIQRVREHHIRPLAGILARDVKAKNIRVLSDLSVPIDTNAQVTRVASKAYGVSLRGVRQYNPYLDRELFRVDLIGGHA